MPTSGWKQLAPAAHDGERLVLVSHLPLTSRSKTGLMLRLSGDVRAQLARTDGVLGYSMRAHVWSGKYWTLSMWRDDAALQAFVAASPHAETMSRLAPSMGQTRFVTFMVPADAPPPSWDDALHRLG